MQDRFKFRYYSTENNKIYDVSAIDLSHSRGEIVSLDGMETLICKLDLNNLIQCSGLKDKNNKLIYEKDIIKCSYCNEAAIGVVEWDSESMQFVLKVKEDFYSFIPKTILDKIEILGSIYENPELLDESFG